MKLEQWMILTGIDLKKFAKSIEKHDSLVHKYMYGDIVPKQETLIKIYLETYGLVSANDFYGISESLLLKKIAEDKKNKASSKDWNLPLDAFKY